MLKPVFIVCAALTLLSACGTTSVPSGVSSGRLTSQSVNTAQITAQKSVTIPLTDAAGQVRGDVTVSAQVRRDSGGAYAVLTYSDTTDLGGFGPYQRGRVVLRDPATGQDIAASARYTTDGPTRTYSLLATPAANGAASPLCAVVATELYDPAGGPHTPVSITACEKAITPQPVPPVSLVTWLNRITDKRSGVQIQLLNAPSGSTMDGVYIIGRYADCDLTGKRQKDQLQYQGDFWTVPSAPTLWTDKMRPYTAPDAGVRVSARVLDSQGNVTGELEAFACLK